MGENIDPAWPPDWWWDGERWRRWATAAGEGGYLYLVDGKTPVVAAGPYVPTRFGKPDPWSEALREQKAGSAIPPDGQGIVAALQYVKKRWEPDVAVIIPRHDGAEEAWLHRGAQSGGALVVSALRWQTKVSAQRGKDLAGRETRRGAFVADPEAVEGRRVVLVDDIVVSGVTMVDAARAVTEAGAAEVMGVCGGWTIEGRAGGRAHVLRADAPER